MLSGCVPWPPELAARYRAKGYWEGLTIWQMVERGITRDPGKTALVAGDARISYAELGDATRRMAAGLISAGIHPLDRIVVQLPNVPAFVFTYLALTAIGAIPVMALRAHRKTEVLHFLRSSGAVAYVIPDVLGTFDYRAMAADVAQERSSLRLVLVDGQPQGGQRSLGELMAGDAGAMHALAGLRVDPSEVATMLLSGGTTSLSKLIPRTHDDYVVNARLCSAAAGFDTHTVFMAILPLAHNYNLASPGMLGTFYCGGTVVLAPSADAAAVCSLVERERVSVIAAVVMAMACKPFCTMVRIRTRRMRWVTSARRSRVAGSGIQTVGNRACFNRSSRWSASRRSVLVFRTTIARIFAASPTISAWPKRCMSS